MKSAQSNLPTKSRILDAALCVVRSKGYTATTVDDLCAEAGVTKGAFFHYFKSKEDLAIAAAEHWSTVTNQLFDSAAFRKHADPLDRFLGYLDLRRELIEGELAEYTCFVGTMVQETYDSSPAIREACRKSIYGHIADIAKDIALAKKQYLPGAKWSAESLALYVQAVIQGSYILAKASRDQKVALESIDHLRNYVELLFQREPQRKK